MGRKGGEVLKGRRAPWRGGWRRRLRWKRAIRDRRKTVEMSRAQRTQITLLGRHLGKLHVGIDMVRRVLQYIVQSVAVGLLKHLEERKLGGTILPRVIEGVPFSLIVVGLGSGVAAELEDAGRGIPARLGVGEVGGGPF